MTTDQAATGPKILAEVRCRLSLFTGLDAALSADSAAIDARLTAIAHDLATLMREIRDLPGILHAAQALDGSGPETPAEP